MQAFIEKFDYCERIRSILLQEISNSDFTQYLNVSENKDKSISIKAKNILVAKVKLQGQNKWIELKSDNTGAFPTDRIQVHSDNMSRIAISDINELLLFKKELCSLYIDVLSEFGGESFGCCHRYVQCSDAKQCIHPDYFFSRACSYRKNLEAGRIFYGKNKTI